jgi:rubrerythrin
MRFRRRELAARLPGSCAMTDSNQAPGDEAAPGTPGTGENLCRHCGGTGEHDGRPCPVCGGTGKAIEGLAGG